MNSNRLEQRILYPTPYHTVSGKKEIIASAAQTPEEKIRGLLKEYERINQDFSDHSEKKILEVLSQIELLVATGVPAAVDRELADVLRDEYASKHFAVDTVVKRLLSVTQYGQRLLQTLNDIQTGEFLDQYADTSFLTPDEYTQYAGEDGLMSYAEAVIAKKEVQALQFILPAALQKQTGKEFVFLRPGDLLFTGAARKRDDIDVFPNAYFWGGLFGFIGMQRMHVGAYIGAGQIIESGKSEEGTLNKQPGWNGVTTENIYDSIFSTGINNGITSIAASKDIRDILVTQLVNEEGLDYDFLHSLQNKDVDCAELIVKAYANQSIVSSKTEAKPDAIYKATKNILY